MIKNKGRANLLYLSGQYSISFTSAFIIMVFVCNLTSQICCHNLVSLFFFLSLWLFLSYKLYQDWIIFESFPLYASICSLCIVRIQTENTCYCWLALSYNLESRWKFLSKYSLDVVATTFKSGKRLSLGNSVNQNGRNKCCFMISCALLVRMGFRRVM